MIRRSESTFTKRSLTYNAAESGKLIGYVRLARDTPAVVLPVFVDAVMMTTNSFFISGSMTRAKFRNLWPTRI